ncbi:DUF3343 domain-containing protein [Citroniella saccharovorans]|uniref:DUF3343 domain-containing protein n=1 Tax=Citroniella saccharovorans TaxID=2053367 RepID=A0AAW9MWE3_9FIRM|nr:DUF3343 domain-containing protein [Citroniella saccharovorans]MEB3428834.1 DUF3343 domain-containing protein [Citroniella saccharovorans]
MDKKIIITFESVNYAMKAEKLLKEKEVAMRTIPTPRKISNSCGLCIVTDFDRLEKIKNFIDEGLVVKDLYLKENDEYNLI